MTAYDAVLLYCRSVGATHPLTKLRITLDADTDPEDTYSEVPYEKGALLCSRSAALLVQTPYECTLQGTRL
jgi:hypothetical protein